MAAPGTALSETLKALIAADGPIPVSVFMSMCLHDPVRGYYAKGGGLGRDFTTAPETSQAFGELIGLWCAHEWAALGAPDPFHLVELGPGRGTLMNDALRATRARADFHGSLALSLVEASPVLRTEQRSRLQPHGAPVQFAADLQAVPVGPMLLIANEFLDCLPARQFVKDGDGAWRERVIGLSSAGDFIFGLATEQAPPPASQPATKPAPTIEQAVEIQPALETLVHTLAARADPFRALFIDYGPADHTPSDTLRAFRSGQQVDPLEAPGDSDLTVDVDFRRLRTLAEAAGLSVHGPIPQGQFLMALGLQARLDRLIKANPQEAQSIFDQAQRLVDPDGMGTRFQVICLSRSGGDTDQATLPVPAGF
ncbi:MAG: SAM-dependent methyltransferase [Pseudomonadota bacterium]